MYTASEKLAIIHLVEDSELSIRRTLVEINVSRSSFYRWYQAYERDGPDGLQNHSRASRQHWNKIPESVRKLVVDVALDQPELTPRELVWQTLPESCYFIFSTSGSFQDLSNSDASYLINSTSPGRQVFSIQRSRGP